MQKIYFKSKEKGFTLVEILIGCAIMTTMIFALMASAQKGINLSDKALKQTQANMLLEEGAEAVRSIRDSAWSNISGLTLDTNYYLSYNTSTNVWSLSTTPSATLDSTFTRTVVVSQVLRDATTEDIASSGNVDSRTKKITITVSWPTAEGTTISKDLPFYIADIFN